VKKKQKIKKKKKRKKEEVMIGIEKWKKKSIKNVKVLFYSDFFIIILIIVKSK
jgi:hypothetical protein